VTWLNQMLWFGARIVCRDRKLIWKARAYYVPTTLFVFPSVSFELNIFARPKSEILGFISESKRMLLAFTSLCIMRNLECLCKYRSPCAVPSIIISRLFQLIKVLLVSSAH